MDLFLYWAAGIVTVGGALTVLWRLFIAGNQTRKKWDTFLEDWHGSPARPGRPAVPGVMQRLVDAVERLDALEGNVAAIRHEVFPNSGGSLRDAVDRLEVQWREASGALVPSPRRPGEYPVAMAGRE